MIRFYENKLSQLIDNPDLFGESAVSVVIVGSSYIFEVGDARSDIIEQVTTEIDLSGISYEYRNDVRVYTIPDITFPLVSANIYLRGIVVFVSGEPFFYIDQIPGLSEGSSVHGRPVISFSRDQNRALSITSDDQILYGNHFVYVRRENEPLKEPETISRPGGNISPEQASSGDYKSNDSLYKDLDIRGIPHPLTGDITSVTNMSSINQSLRNILLTDPNERPFSSGDIAGGIKSLLFNEYIDVDLAKRQITTTVTNYEPRIILNEVNFKEYPDQNALVIELVYTVKRSARTVRFDLMLERN